jgi:uncharacterized membrane protein HdeD (DUF308 family)
MHRIPTRTHAVIDYVMAVVLILTPLVFLFNHDEAVKWPLIGVGVVTFIASLLTDDELGIAWLIPMPGHLALDILLGLFLIASPWLFGFSGDIWWPHVILGIVKIVTGLLTRSHPGIGNGVPPSVQHGVAGQH